MSRAAGKRHLNPGLESAAAACVKPKKKKRRQQREDEQSPAGPSPTLGEGGVQEAIEESWTQPQVVEQPACKSPPASGSLPFENWLRAGSSTVGLASPEGAFKLPLQQQVQPSLRPCGTTAIQDSWRSVAEQVQEQARAEAEARVAEADRKRKAKAEQERLQRLEAEQLALRAELEIAELEAEARRKNLQQRREERKAEEARKHAEAAGIQRRATSRCMTTDPAQKNSKASTTQMPLAAQPHPEQLQTCKSAAKLSGGMHMQACATPAPAAQRLSPAPAPEVPARAAKAAADVLALEMELHRLRSENEVLREAVIEMRSAVSTSEPRVLPRAAPPESHADQGHTQDSRAGSAATADEEAVAGQHNAADNGPSARLPQDPPPGAEPTVRGEDEISVASADDDESLADEAESSNPKDPLPRALDASSDQPQPVRLDVIRSQAVGMPAAAMRLPPSRSISRTAVYSAAGDKESGPSHRHGRSAALVCQRPAGPASAAKGQVLPELRRIFATPP
eukprot:TRINITY_DN19309_c0_g1_i7.p1 TRINITY_DN19309_c0_g1~~TRINITY_DN19309_c0_g1_i7.p1  ORF type:complete len:510 (-),score=141.17 TRINITY_DN19309_c0_g1_i7:211-1740(-)